MSAATQPTMTYAEYLAREAVSEEKHDFIPGELIAVAGGTPEQSALAAALIRAIGNGVEGKPCRVFTSDMRIRVPSTGAAFHPDLSVVWGRAQKPLDDDLALENPVVIVEILSPTTEAYDRGAKAAHYRRLPSLKEYVLVSQAERRIEVQRLNERGIWELHFYEPGTEVELQSLQVRFAVDPLYVDPLAG